MLRFNGLFGLSLALGLGVAAAACGNDPGGGEGDTDADTGDSDDDDDDDPPEDDDATSPATSETEGTSGGPTTMDPTSESETAPGSSETGDTDDTTDIPPTSPACGMPASSDWYAPYEVYWGEQTLRAEVDAGGITREYIIELPEPYDPNTPYPVVFTFHGLGALMDNAFGQHIGDVWGQQVVAVYPQGLDNTWDLSPGGPDVSMFTSVLNQIGNELCLDMRQIFVQGTSMGGGMTNFLACVMGDLVSGAGPTASWFPISADQCVGPVPIFIIHGMNDGTVSFNSGVQARDTWLSINGCSSESTPYDPAPCVIYDDCDGGAPVVWCAHNGGHDLPSVHGLDDDMMSFFMGLE